MHRMVKKIARGMRLGCSPLLRLSVTEHTTKRRMKVPINWRRDMRSFNALEKDSYFIEKAVGRGHVGELHKRATHCVR
jgi:hypothetical protein